MPFLIETLHSASGYVKEILLVSTSSSENPVELLNRDY